MKKLQRLLQILPIIIGVLFVTSITSCSSDDDSDNSFNESDLIGQWKLDNMNVTQEGTMSTNGISSPFKTETTGTGGEDNYLTFNENHTFEVTGSTAYVVKTFVNNILIDTSENTFNYDDYTFQDNTWEIVNGNELQSGLFNLSTSNNLPPNITIVSNNTVTTITTLTDAELSLTLFGEIVVQDNEENTETTFTVSGEAHYIRN